MPYTLQAEYRYDMNRLSRKFLGRKTFGFARPLMRIGRWSLLNLRFATPIYVGVASIPTREQSLKACVESLIHQVDVIYVYLNDYSEIPDFLKRPGIRVFRSQEHGDLNDRGKFYGLRHLSWRHLRRGIYLTADDDLVYPDDYAAKMHEKVKVYKSKAIVGVHGVVYPSYPRSFFNRKVFHYARSTKYDQPVSVLGTGTVAIPVNRFRFTLADMPHPGMADLWLAVKAKREQVPLICVSRPSGWVSDDAFQSQNPDDDESTLYDETRRDSTAHDAVIYKNTPWGGRELFERLARNNLIRHMALSLKLVAEILFHNKPLEAAASQYGQRKKTVINKVQGYLYYVDLSNQEEVLWSFLKASCRLPTTRWSVIKEMENLSRIHAYKTCIYCLEEGPITKGVAKKWLQLSRHLQRAKSDLTQWEQVYSSHLPSEFPGYRLKYSLRDEQLRFYYAAERWDLLVACFDTELDCEDLPTDIVARYLIASVKKGSATHIKKALKVLNRRRNSQSSLNDWRWIVQEICGLSGSERLLIKAHMDAATWLRGLSRSAESCEIVKILRELECENLTYSKRKGELASIGRIAGLCEDVWRSYVEREEGWPAKVFQQYREVRTTKHRDDPQDSQSGNRENQGSWSIDERNEKPLVTVLVTAYNAAATIRETLASIEGQTYENIEILLVDDASTDSTKEEVRAYENGPRPLTIIQNQRNLGPYASRNAALKHAKGDYVAIQDADDISHPRRIEKQARVLMERDTLVAVTATHTRVDDKGVLQLENTGELLGHGPMTLMFRASIVEEIGPFLEVRTRGDLEFIDRVRCRWGDRSRRHLDEMLLCAQSRESSNSKIETLTVEKRMRLAEFKERYRYIHRAYAGRISELRGRLESLAHNLK